MISGFSETFLAHSCTDEGIIYSLSFAFDSCLSLIITTERLVKGGKTFEENNSFMLVDNNARGS